MKLGPVSKLDTRNKATSQNLDKDVMPGSCKLIVTFPIFGKNMFSENS